MTIISLFEIQMLATQRSIDVINMSSITQQIVCYRVSAPRSGCRHAFLSYVHGSHVLPSGYSSTCFLNVWAAKWVLFDNTGWQVWHSNACVSECDIVIVPMVWTPSNNDKSDPWSTWHNRCRGVTAHSNPCKQLLVFERSQKVQIGLKYLLPSVCVFFVRDLAQLRLGKEARRARNALGSPTC